MAEAECRAHRRVAAIVLNFRLVDETLRVIGELRRLGDPDLATIIVENGSADGSAERLAGALHDDPDTTLLTAEHNLGYCGGVNLALRRAREVGAEYALLLNNDCSVPRDFLAPLVAALDADRSLAAVAPTIVTPDGKVWSEGGIVRARTNLVVLRGQGREAAPRQHGPEACEFLPGACALYRVSDLAAVGDLDESYFMYWEDADLGARLRAAGRKLVWLPWVRVVHAPSASSGGGRSPLRKYLSAANTVRWLRRHGRLRHWLAFAVGDVLLFPLTFVSGTGPRAAVAKGRGLIAGLLGHPITRADVERYVAARPPRHAAAERSAGEDR